MYVTAQALVMDDPANTTAVYRKQCLLSRQLDATAWTWTPTTPGPRGSPRQSPEESGQLEGPPSTPLPRREDARGIDIVLAGLGPVDEAGGPGTPGSYEAAGRPRVGEAQRMNYRVPPRPTPGRAASTGSRRIWAR